MAVFGWPVGLGSGQSVRVTALTLITHGSLVVPSPLGTQPPRDLRVYETENFLELYKKKWVAGKLRTRGVSLSTESK